MTAYIKRSIVVHDMPFKQDKTLFRPESTVLRFGGTWTTDIGAVCFVVRSPEHRHPPNLSRLVKAESLRNVRTRWVRDVIEYISDVATNGTLRPRTLMGYVSSWIMFFDWCDNHHYSEVIEDESTTREAYRAYIHHLWDRIRRESLSPNTAHSRQNTLLHLMRTFVGIENIDVGIRRILMSERTVEPTPVPDEQAQSRVLSLCHCLFTGLSELVIDKRPYPFRMPMPEYLGWEESILWVFPGPCWSMAPHRISCRDTQARPRWAFDYAGGRVATFEEIKHRYSIPKSARQSIKLAKLWISDANADNFHYRRMQAGLRAHNAFVVMFVAHTGMNWAQVTELRWSEDYDIGVDRQGFRRIKYRAANKTVSFQIEARFLRVFKRYLKLRKYLTERYQHTDYLFFSLGRCISAAPTQLGRSPFTKFYILLRHIDPTLSKIMPRSWRTAKSDWLIRHTDLATTALVLQNSERTVAQSYATGSESRAIEEVSQFFDRVSQSVKQTARKASTDSTDNAVGECLKYGKPIPEAGAPIKPDCHQAEGCLFCDKYAVHADQRDVRKLISCRYCIGRTAHLSASKEHFESIYNAVFQRIDRLLTHIGDLSEEHRAMVKMVRQEVDEDGELDPYWARKLDMLIQLGVVSA